MKKMKNINGGEKNVYAYAKGGSKEELYSM